MADATGIDKTIIEQFEKGKRTPTGDEILILADFFKCDYNFFISNERLAPFEQTETLFRKHGDELSKADRWAIQEVLYLADCEHYLHQQVGLDQQVNFSFTKRGNFFKGHGKEAAHNLRLALDYTEKEVPRDVYRDFRKIGIHVFRRRLENSNISGMYIRHPVAGKCIIINYLEDMYRQRFTAAHEAAHAILDDEEDIVVSFNEWEKGDLVEIRANIFASNYLMPPDFMRSIPFPSEWSQEKAREWASKLKVSTEALAYSLKALGLITDESVQKIKSVIVSSDSKTDAELSGGLSGRGEIIKKQLLEKGLASNYVCLCFNAYRENIISAGRMAEMLLVTEPELLSIGNLYGEDFRYGD